MKKLLLSLLVVSTLGQVQAESESKTAISSKTSVDLSSQSDVVVVDMRRVFSMLDEFKEEFESLNVEIRIQEEEIQKSAEIFGKKAQAFEVKKNTLDPKVREKQEKELMEEYRLLEKDKQDAMVQRQETGVRIEGKYMKKIGDFCRKQGWKIVIPMAVYVAPECDKTEEVVVGLNKEYKRAQEAKKKAKEAAQAKK